MALEQSDNYENLQSNSFKTIKINGREPAANETFFIRYVGKDEDGKRVVGKVSAALNFTNVGTADTKYSEAPAITAVPATYGYIVSWPIPDKTKYPNYLYTEIYESKTVNNFGVAELDDPEISYKGSTSSNSITINTPQDLDQRYVRVRHIGGSNAVSPLSNVATVKPRDPVDEAVDSEAPGPIQSATASASADSTDSSGISGIINLAIVNNAAVVPNDFQGYIIKIIRQSDSKEWYQKFYSSSYLTTIAVKQGIVVGQSYSLSVSTTDGRNNSVYVNVTGNPISVTDTRTNDSTVSGSLSFSATDSILTVTWGASTDPQVGSYRVQLTSNADTNFSSVLQTVISNGTTASFGGLSPNTTYRVRVTTRYANSNLLSINHTSGTFTLNSSGAISDGAVPTVNPTPTVKSLFKAFALYWDEIINNDPVTYEVYVKTVNSTNIVSPGNKVMEIDGTFAVINALADGTEVQYPAESNPTSATDYYFAIRAKDNDGISSGNVPIVGPFTASRTGRFDIASNAIYANHITAGEIKADKMETDLLFVDKTINVGESTSLNRIRLASSIATPVTMTDPALPSPSTYSVKSRIFIGAGNYFNNGTYFYADNTGRFSLGDKLRFDGSNLSIIGSGTFTGKIEAGTGSQKIVVGNGANGSNNGIFIDATDDYIYTDGTFQLGGTNGITYNGATLNIKGTVEIKGSSSITGDLNVASGSTFYIGGSKTSGDRIIVNEAGIAAYKNGVTEAQFLLATDGTITAKTGTFSGTVEAGIIRGSTITSTAASYVKIDGVNLPSAIQLWAQGFTIPGYIDFTTTITGGGIADTLGELTIRPPANAGFAIPEIRLLSQLDVGGSALMSLDADAIAMLLGDVQISFGSQGATIFGPVLDGVTSLRNITAYNGFGPPGTTSRGLNQVGDIVLFYT